MRLVVLLAALLFTPAASAQFGDGANTSGAPLSAEAAAIDVLHYALRLKIDPEARLFDGTLEMHAQVVAPTDGVVLQLDDAFTVEAVRFCEEPCGERGPVAFVRRPGELRAELGYTAEPGTDITVVVDYAGAPPVAARPPWSGGVTWAETADGQPWVAVSCQGEGADVWWPVKDHPSDEPESMSIALTVPAGLRGIANGAFQGRTLDGDWATERWLVTTPINNYGVSFGVAPYQEVSMAYTGSVGTEMTVPFYVLPERAADAERQLPGFLDALDFLERAFGPYAFAEDGYKVLHTPYLGMEHQTLIAYGSTFEDNAYGFDWLHFHELAHEWWANAGTAADWNDFWIHESFANYAEALYAEDLARRRGGDARQAYLGYISDVRGRINNTLPVAPRETRTTKQMYTLPDGGFNGDIYFKGSWFLHTLRFLMQDDPAFMAAFPAILRTHDGPRFLSTADVQSVFEEYAGRDLDAYFEAYLRHAALPRLVTTLSPTGSHADFAWIVPDGVEGFELPVPVRVGANLTGGGRYEIVPMPGGRGRVAVGDRVRLEVDPLGEILFAAD